MNEWIRKKWSESVKEKTDKISAFIYEKSDGHIPEYSFLFSLNQTHFGLPIQVYHL